MKQFATILTATLMIASTAIWADDIEVTNNQQYAIAIISEEQVQDEMAFEEITETAETEELEEASSEQEEAEVILEDGTAATELEVAFVTAVLKNLHDNRPFAFQKLVKKAFNVEVKFHRFAERKLTKIGILRADGSFAEHVQDIILAKTRINESGKAELIGYEGKPGVCKHNHGKGHGKRHGKGHDKRHGKGQGKAHGHFKGEWHHRFR